MLHLLDGPVKGTTTDLKRKKPGALNSGHWDMTPQLYHLHHHCPNELLLLSFSLNCLGGTLLSALLLLNKEVLVSTSATTLIENLLLLSYGQSWLVQSKSFKTFLFSQSSASWSIKKHCIKTKKAEPENKNTGKW